MKLPAQKELTPVLYEDYAIKIYPDFSADAGRECFPLHWHDRLELLLILHGQMEIQFGDEFQAVPANHLAIINARQPHRGMAGPEGVQYCVLMFEPSALQNKTPASDKYIDPILRNQTTFLSVTDHPEILSAIHQIVQLHLQPEVHPLQIIGLVYGVLGLFFRYCTTQKRITPREEKLFSPVVEYINLHFTEKLSTSSLSRRFGYDEAYFCRRFKQITGITAMKYIQILRLEYAQQLLQRSDDNIGDIAGRCGFPDLCYFTRCFHKHFGSTPNAFRKERRR